MNRMCLEN